MALKLNYDFLCAAENCDKPTVYNSGYCNAHYQRLNLYGRLETVVWGQTQHPYYHMWNERKNKGLLCETWLDFKEFIKGLGEKPGEHFKLYRIDKSKPFGPDNFIWKPIFKKLPNETRLEYEIRRRKVKPEIYKNYELKKNFKINYDTYLQLLNKQNNVCAICSEPEKVIHHVTGKKKSLAVDHCHSTNKIRGLLCQRCNRVLGKLQDRVDLLDRMKAYLNGNGA